MADLEYEKMMMRQLPSSIKETRAAPIANRLIWIITPTITVEDVKELVAKGADPNACDWTYDTPLLSAIRRGNKPVVKYLVEECKAPLNANLKNHDLPLWVAVEKNDLAMVELLLKLNADPNLPSYGAYHRRFKDLFALIDAHLATPRSVACYVHNITNFKAIKNLLEEKLSWF